MRTFFWLSVLLLLYAYAGYPLLLWLLAKRELERSDQDNPLPEISLIIPVYNEEDVISDKIANTRSLDYPADKLEVIFVSDASTDRTDELIREQAGPEARLFRLSARTGKAGALNRGLQAAGGDIVVFSDAAILLEKSALRRVVQPFGHPQVGCVSGEDHVVGGGDEGVYGRYELFLRNLESRVLSIVGASGCFYAVRRELCEGFPPGLAPDFHSVLATVRKGFRAVTEPSAKGWMKNPADRSQAFERKVRTFLRGMATLFHERGLLNPFRYGVFSLELLSHKLLRWFGGILLITAFISNSLLLDSPAFILLFAMQAYFYGLALAALLRGPAASGPLALRVPFFFCMVHAAGLLAGFQFLRGMRMETWEPTRR